MEEEEVRVHSLKRRQSSFSDKESSNEPKKPILKPKTYREESTVVVRNLPKGYNFFKVRKLFKDCGNIKHIDVKQVTNEDSKVARIEFEDFNDVLSALTKSHKRLGDQEIIVEQSQNSTLWVTNYPPLFGELELQKLFSQFGGTVLSIRFPSLRYDSHRRFAYVDMASSEEAKLIVDRLHGFVVDNHELIIMLSNPLKAEKRTDSDVLERRQVHLKNLDYFRVSEEIISKSFSKYGHIERISLPHKEEPGLSGAEKRLNDGFGFVTFSESASAASSLQLDGSELEGRKISVTLADRKAYIERQAVKRLLYRKRGNENVVGIFPLSDKVSVMQLQAFIIEHTKIQSTDLEAIYLVSDHEGALIVARDGTVAARISLAINGQKFDNKALTCCSATALARHSHTEAGVRPAKGSMKVTAEKTDVQQSNVENGKKMTNDDFRRMFLHI